MLTQMKSHLQGKNMKQRDYNLKLDKKDEIHKIEQRKSIVDKNFSAVRSIEITYAGVAWYTNIKDILENG